MFKEMGGGVKGFLNNVKKKCTFLSGWLPLEAIPENSKVMYLLDTVIFG